MKSSGGARAGVFVWCARGGGAGRQSFEAVVYNGCVWCVLCGPCANFGADRPLEAVFCIGSALQTWAHSLTQITIGRAIGGLGVGALRYPPPVLSTMSSKMFDRPPGTSVT